MQDEKIAKNVELVANQGDGAEQQESGRAGEDGRSAEQLRLKGNASPGDYAERAASARSADEGKCSVLAAQQGSGAPVIDPESVTWGQVADELRSATMPSQKRPSIIHAWLLETSQNCLIATAIASALILFGWVVLAALDASHSGFSFSSHPNNADYSWYWRQTMLEWFPMTQLRDAGGVLGGMAEVLALLPFAALGCAVVSSIVFYLARESKSRDIDWTDSHLFLEGSGPITLAVRWSALESVRQIPHFDVLTGTQPMFLLSTHEGHSFKLKVADIAQKHNIGAFFSMIKTNAPKAVLTVDPGFSNDNSYTELWLKYFSAPSERRRTGLLEPEMTLDGGRYRIVGTVGGGGQGTAYLATREEPADRAESTSEHIISIPAVLPPSSQVVLKEYVLPMHRGQLTAERTAEKLKAEANLLTCVDHPQVVKLLDAFVEDYRGYLVLEYVQGETLKERVERLGPQPEESVIDWALQMCGILRYLHMMASPVVHRDITPDNIILQEDGSLKLVDFNVAYQVDSTSTATVVGKHAYIPPEQFRGKPTPQSDIYALGCTMFYLLAGKDPQPIIRSHPRKWNERVSEQLDAIIAEATAPTARDRTADVATLEALLRQLASEIAGRKA